MAKAVCTLYGDDATVFGTLTITQVRLPSLHALPSSVCPGACLPWGARGSLSGYVWLTDAGMDLCRRMKTPRP